MPPDVLENLAEYGKREFDSTQHQNVTPTLAMATLQTDLRVSAKPEEAAGEICRAASSQGAWALYGAFAAIHAFLPAGMTAPEYQSTMDDGLRFIRSLGMPRAVLKGRMRGDVRVRWGELFPGDD